MWSARLVIASVAFVLLASCQQHPRTFDDLIDEVAAHPVTFHADPYPYEGIMSCQSNEIRRPERCTFKIAEYTARGESGGLAKLYQWQTSSGKIVTFIGHGGGEFWFGRLNGRDAAGYQLNRGHIVFQTEDGSLNFEYWYEGSNQYDVPDASR